MPNRVPGQVQYGPLDPTIAATLPRGWIDGYVTTYSSNTDISFAAGSCRDSTNAINMETTSALVKEIDNDWAEGTTAGGFSDALTLANNTWYHLFVIGKSGSGTGVDAGFDTSIIAANLLDNDTAGGSGYDLFRRVGAVKTDTGATTLISYFQNHDTFLWDVPVNSVNLADISATTEQLGVVTTPLGIQVEAALTIRFLTDDIAPDKVMVLYSPDVTGVAPVATTGLAHLTTAGTSDASEDIVSSTKIWTDTSSQVAFRLSGLDGTTQFDIATHGWTDPRGRNA